MVLLDESRREDYDIVQGKWRDIKSHSEWLDKLFKQHGIKTVLSLGCGTGSYEVYLAKMGYEVLGVDYNPNMISQAKARAKKEQVKIRFIEGDIRNFDYGKFDAVISLWAPIMFACQDIKQVEKAIKCMKRAMKPTSIGLFETGTPKLMYSLDEVSFDDLSIKEHKKAQIAFLERDEKRNKSYVTYLIGVKERNKKLRTEVITTTYNLYTKQQFSTIFKKLGMKVMGWYGGFDHQGKKLYSKYTKSSGLITLLFKL